MMKILTLLAVMCFGTCYGQFVTGNYVNFYNPKWDKAIGTYNSSRPFLTDEISVLKNKIALSYVHNLGDSSYSEFTLSYAFNDKQNDFNISFGWLELGYLYHINTNWILKEKGIISFYGGVSLGSLARKEAGKDSFVDDEIRMRTYGIGISLGSNFVINVSRRVMVSVKLEGTPYNYYYRSPVILAANNHPFLTDNSWSLNAGIGLIYKIRE